MMKTPTWPVLGLIALAAGSLQAQVTVTYNFNTSGGGASSADSVVGDVTASSISWTTGSTADGTDGKPSDTPPHWKKSGTSAVLSFTVTNDGPSAIDISSLAFDVQMDSTDSEKERELRITSDLTGATVLHTVYNYHAARDESLALISGDYDWITQDWTNKNIGLSGVAGLQGLAASASVTFSLSFVDVSPGTPVNGNLRMDDVILTATAVPEPSTYALLSGLGALLLVMIHRRIKYDRY